MEWMWSKTARRKLTGMSGLGLDSETSQMRSVPPTWNSLICREVEAAAAWVSVQPACASASRRRPSLPDVGVNPGPAALAGPADTAAADAAGCTAGGRSVDQRDRFCPSCTPVHHGQQVGTASR